MKKYSFFALYLFTGEVFVRLIGFCAIVYLARILNAAGFGLITIGLSFLTYSLLLSDSGLKTLGFLETSKPEQKRQIILSDILTGKLFQALLSFFVLSIVSVFLFKEKNLFIICIFYLLDIFYDALFLEWYFKGLQRFRTVAAARISTSIIYFISLLIFVKTPADTIKVPIIFFITNMISVAILFTLLPSTPFRMKFSFSFKKYFAIIGQSLILGISTLLNQITIYLPPIVIGLFCTIKESGIFGAAMRIIMVIMIVDRIFSTIFLSALPRMWENNRETAKQNLQTILHIVMATGFLLSLVTCMGAETIVYVLFGDNYKDSYTVLSILSWFVALTMLNSVFVYGIISIGDKKLYLKSAFQGFLFNIIFITGLVFYHGKYGVSIAVVLGELCFTILFHREFKKFCALKFYTPFLKTCFICAVTIFAVYSLQFHPIVKTVIAAAGYVILIFILKTITKDDITLLITKWKKN